MNSRRIYVKIEEEELEAIVNISQTEGKDPHDLLPILIKIGLEKYVKSDIDKSRAIGCGYKHNFSNWSEPYESLMADRVTKIVQLRKCVICSIVEAHVVGEGHLPKEKEFASIDKESEEQK